MKPKYPFARRTRALRRLIRAARRPYRICFCTLALCLAFTAIAMRASELITPHSIEHAALDVLLSSPARVEVNPVSGLSSCEEPTCNSLYESEIFVLEGAGDPAPSPDAAPNDDGVLPITRLDLSGPPDRGRLQMRNSETDFSPDLETLFAAEYPYKESPPPSVLILHTHGTECYSENGSYYTPDTSFRSRDTSKNVVAVGALIAAELNAAGITALHCPVMHDAEDYNSSYELARATIEAALESNPSIRYIIDVHRDAIIRSDGELIAPCVETPEGRAAQLMLVVGTNALGADHPSWQDNLNIACKLQAEMNAEYRLARPIDLRGASFNEQFRAGSMLLEVGSCGNTLEEAKLAARLFARAFIATVERYE